MRITFGRAAEARGIHRPRSTNTSRFFIVAGNYGRSSAEANRESRPPEWNFISLGFQSGDA
jgi:hypothetical protein